MVFDTVPTKILIPNRILEIKDEERLQREILSYLQQKYPEFSMIGFKDTFALCIWEGGESK